MSSLPTYSTAAEIDAPPAARERLVRSLSRALFDSHVFVSAGLGSLVLHAQHVLGTPYALGPAVGCAGGVFAIYNFDDWLDPAPQRHPEGATPGRRLAATWIGLALAFACIDWRVVLYTPALAVTALLGFGYALPLWRGGRLKDLPGLKAWIVACAIVTATYGLAWATTDSTPDRFAHREFVIVLILAAANVHICDLRDLTTDTQRAVPTLARLLGSRLRPLFFVLTVMATGLAVTGGHPELAIATTAATAFVIRLDSTRAPWEFSLWADGALFLPALTSVSCTE